jgi:hypothetical protein
MAAAIEEHCIKQKVDQAVDRFVADGSMPAVVEQHCIKQEVDQPADLFVGDDSINP